MERIELKSLPFGVNMRNIHINMRDHEGMARIASLIGKPIRLDRANEERPTNSFSGVLFEVEASKPLSTILALIYDSAKVYTVNVDYNCVPVRCN
ncbi:hypothetical protein GIB67_006654 [Kingdonia uniflora]|uniref:Uncharacterized protein n=1 Tax=Kingdonia uniflora TaxID=39325 RepID=A0A7J7LAL1_9MAGN|nr:hypothetical protein GIB67_006654 [Kingdonia uniflora]